MSQLWTLFILSGVTAAAAAVLIRIGRGFLARWRQIRETRYRVQREDAVKHLHKWEMSGRRPTMQSLAGALHITLDQAASLVSDLERHHLLEMQGEEFRLTPSGRSGALHIIRAHRLWERYLADETGLAESDWHDSAERQEHTLSPAQAENLSTHLGRPTHDPHGDPIPTADGRLVPHGGQPLAAMPVNRLVRIVHIEDEPKGIYEQLVAEGFCPGMIGKLTEVSAQGVHLWVEGEEHVLTPLVAANISAVGLPAVPRVESASNERLIDLRPGEKGEVITISPLCRGLERRRFMDLGILPGTVIEAEFQGPSGDPTAYRIRGAVIALRREQAKSVQIRRLGEVES